MSNKEPEYLQNAKSGNPNNHHVEIEERGQRYFLYLPGGEADYIQGRILNDRSPYELDMLRDMNSRLSPGDLVIDVGANVGNHTVFLAAVAGARVVAFEPNGNLANVLNVSVRQNALEERVRVEEVALGREESIGHFEEELPGNLGAQRVEIGDGPLRIVPLASYTFEQPIRAIKIDVEGMELDVLQGANEHLEEQRPLLYVECQDEAQFGRVNAFLEKLGYSYWDTFNATPSHLFIHKSELSQQTISSRVLYKLAETEYALRSDVESLRKRLDDSNKKYRSAQAQITELKEKLDGANEKYRLSSQQLQLAKEDVQESEKRQSKAEQRLEVIERKLAETRSAHAEERAELLRLYESEHEALQTAQAKREEAEQQWVGAQTDADALRANVEELQQQIEQREKEYRERHSEAEQRLEVIERELAETRSAHAEERAELLRLYESEHEALQTAQAKREEAEQQWVGAQTDADALRANVEELQQQIEQREKEYRERHSEAEQRLEVIERELAETRSAHAEERAELLRLYESEHEALHTAQAKREEAEQQWVAAQKDADALRAKLAEAASRKQKLQLEVAKAKAARQKAEARQAEILSSRTYLLGHHLRRAVTSWRGLATLPSSLWRLTRHRSQMAKSVPTRTVSNDVGRGGGLPSKAGGVQPSKVPSGRSLARKLRGEGVRNVRMACVMDEFTQRSFDPECKTFALTPDAWKEDLETARPDLLFVESAWRGKDESWGNKVGHTSDELRGVVDWCRRRSIPTVFWNKEDPVHFETFLNTARLFDYVFTTDFDCIHRYKAMLGHDRVYLLPFACQPRIHNPLEQYDRKDAFCFAGAYYTRYTERIRNLESFVEELPEFRPLEIFDRNYGQNDPNYAFPERYHRYIQGSLPVDQIDKAYKGYRYAVNLNSIKQSQTMFARRVFELLGSNTITVSNYSRGLRLLFADLVLTSDSGRELRTRVESLRARGDEDRFRLAGLRKALSEHTYAERLRYVLSKTTGASLPASLPQFRMIGRADSPEDIQRLVEHCRRQEGVSASLTVVLGDGMKKRAAKAILRRHKMNVTVKSLGDVDGRSAAQLSASEEWIAFMVAKDYYGPHYLLDLALTTRYSSSSIVGKGRYYVWDEATERAAVRGEAQPYTTVSSVAARRAVVSSTEAQKIGAHDVLANPHTQQLTGASITTIDCYNYCEGGAAVSDIEAVTSVVDDLSFETGIPLDALRQKAEAIEPTSEQTENTPHIDGRQLHRLLRGRPFEIRSSTDPDGEQEYSDSDHEVINRADSVHLQVEDGNLEIESSLRDGTHEYVYAGQNISVAEFTDRSGGAAADQIRLHLQMEPGLNVRIVVLFLDETKQRLGHAIEPANRNVTLSLPDGTQFLKLGLRVYAGGRSGIKRLLLGHRDVQPPEVLGQSDVLLLTNHYPSYDDLYRNGFVHSRVRAYRERGVRVDVFRLRKGQPISWHEFENTDVTTGSQQALRRALASGQYRHVLVHFLDPDMWAVLGDFVDDIPVTVWVHGAEIQPWHRRAFESQSDEMLERAKSQSDARIRFWRELLQSAPAKLRLVFVSAYLAEVAMTDLGLRLPEHQYDIIHNAIDTELFAYHPKEPEQRKRILSIRPYASRIYANDLTVQAILMLSEKPFFDDLEFRIIGDGRLFETTVEPLRGFNNVMIERRFLSQFEIASIHQSYGVFLCPSRMDTQGVSRDEAMASGLVPVTTAVAAIPEFVDSSSGILAAPEDAGALAAGIERLYMNPEEFQSLSRNAAKRVQRQSSKNRAMSQELSLLSADVESR